MSGNCANVDNAHLDFVSSVLARQCIPNVVGQFIVPCLSEKADLIFYAESQAVVKLYYSSIHSGAIILF